jgi:hypothetical protein
MNSSFILVIDSLSRISSYLHGCTGWTGWEKKPLVNKMYNVGNGKNTHILPSGNSSVILLPLDAIQYPCKADDSAWDELARLGAEIARDWQSHQTSLEILSELRR